LRSADIPLSISGIAHNLGCSAAILRYYFPDHCKSIIDRHRRLNELEAQRQALEAPVAAEQVSLSVNEIARHLGCSSSVLYTRFPELCQAITERHFSTVFTRQHFPELSRSIARRYMNHGRERRDKRIQRIREAIKQAALLLHSQGIRPNTTRVGDIIGVPARFRMPEAREALREAMNELGYEW